MVSKRLVATAFVGSILIVGAVIAAQHGGGSAPSIVGVWKVSEVTFTGPNARKITNPQPSVRIFTRRHYSVSEVTADKPRPETPQGQQATDQQVAFNARNFTGQGGTYEIKGGELLFTPIAAINPNVMHSGNVYFSIFKLEGNTLTITQKGGPAGPFANPITFRLTRIE